LGKLFKLYGFLESSEELNTHGSGLGLYICKKIVEEFGGEISVNSELGIGSKFLFAFKLSEIEIN
jgi:signal transduction histidine kinase